MRHLMAAGLVVFAVVFAAAGPIACEVNAGPTVGSPVVEDDLSGTWTGSAEANGHWDYVMVLKKAAADKFTGSIVWTYNGKKLDPADDITVEIVGAGKLTFNWKGRDTADGTFTKNKMTVNAPFGVLNFTRKP